ncbi:MAG TPA: hypothetical protein VI168_13155 [Croceibacterium sp.]
MKALRLAAAAILLAAAGSVAAQPEDGQTAEGQAAAEPAAGEQPAAAQAATNPAKRICKTEKMTGSLTRVRRTCLTQSQWDRLAEGTRDGVDDIQRDANQSQAINACRGAIAGCVG